MAYKKIGSERVASRLRRKSHIRKRIAGTSARPRLSVFRSLKHIYAQAIDDSSAKVIATASDLDPTLKGELDGLKKSERAEKVGEALGKKLLEQDVKSVVFDRNGYIYHGRVKAVAEGARKAGLEF